MSDKTCGNCGHWHHMKNDCGACLESYSGALSQEVTITGRSESCLIVPNSWAPKTTDTLEQRYQQIVEVARDLFNRAYEFNRDGPCLGGIYIADFREKLEELGVEL